MALASTQAITATVRAFFQFRKFFEIIGGLMTKLLSYDLAANEYGIPKEMIVRAVSSGRLKAIKNGPNWVRLTERALDDWLKALEQVA